MKHTKFDSRNFNKKEKRLCKVCKKQLGKKEIVVHNGCKYDDFLDGFLGGK